jgi:arylsulfatase
VLLVTLDTTRPDHLSSYGYERETSPQLDALASRSVLFTRAWSTSAWTLPAHASLFTGLPAIAHRAQFDVGGEELRLGFRARALAPEFDTLAELLLARGYTTAAFVAGPWLKRQFGALQGFETIADDVPPATGRDARAVTDDALRWIDDTDDATPRFLFVNYFDPHYPYTPPAGDDVYPHARDIVPKKWLDEALAGKPVDPALLRTLIARYDGEIRFMDRELGRLLEAFESRAGGRPILTIVTADHGESFGEDGFYLHNGSLGEEATRVPLVVGFPDGRGAGSRSDAPIQLTDVAAIVAQETGITLTAGATAVLPGERETVHLALRRNAFRVKRFGARYDRDLEGVIAWPHKLVVREPGLPTLSRIDETPEVPVDDPAISARLAAALQRHHAAQATTGEATSVELEDETVESLRALGYLD